MMDDDFQGFRCICGDWVAVMHAECKALLGNVQTCQSCRGQGCQNCNYVGEWSRG